MLAISSSKDGKDFKNHHNGFIKRRLCFTKNTAVFFLNHRYLFLGVNI